MSDYHWSILDQPIPQKWSWDILDPITIKSFLYFIREEGDDGKIKIGVSKKPKKRLIELQVGNPKRLYIVGMRRGLRRDEQRIHAMFSTSREGGEWFEPSLPLLSLIAELSE